MGVFIHLQSGRFTSICILQKIDAIKKALLPCHDCQVMSLHVVLINVYIYISLSPTLIHCIFPSFMPYLEYLAGQIDHL